MGRLRLFTTTDTRECARTRTRTRARTHNSPHHVTKEHCLLDSHTTHWQTHKRNQCVWVQAFRGPPHKRCVLARASEAMPSSGNAPLGQKSQASDLHTGGLVPPHQRSGPNDIRGPAQGTTGQTTASRGPRVGRGQVVTPHAHKQARAHAMQTAVCRAEVRYAQANGGLCPLDFREKRCAPTPNLSLGHRSIRHLLLDVHTCTVTQCTYTNTNTYRSALHPRKAIQARTARACSPDRSGGLRVWLPTGRGFATLTTWQVSTWQHLHPTCRQPTTLHAATTTLCHHTLQ